MCYDHHNQTSLHSYTLLHFAYVGNVTATTWLPTVLKKKTTQTLLMYVSA